MGRGQLLLRPHLPSRFWRQNTPRQMRTGPKLEVGLAVDAARFHVRRPPHRAGGQQDEIGGNHFAIAHQNDVPCADILPRDPLEGNVDRSSGRRGRGLNPSRGRGGLFVPTTDTESVEAIIKAAETGMSRPIGIRPGQPHGNVLPIVDAFLPLYAVARQFVGSGQDDAGVTVRLAIGPMAGQVGRTLLGQTDAHDEGEGTQRRPRTDGRVEGVRVPADGHEAAHDEEVHVAVAPELFSDGLKK